MVSPAFEMTPASTAFGSVDRGWRFPDRRRSTFIYSPTPCCLTVRSCRYLARMHGFAGRFLRFGKILISVRHPVSPRLIVQKCSGKMTMFQMPDSPERAVDQVLVCSFFPMLWLAKKHRP